MDLELYVNFSCSPAEMELTLLVKVDICLTCELLLIIPMSVMPGRPSIADIHVADRPVADTHIMSHIKHLCRIRVAVRPRIRFVGRDVGMIQ